jgi:fibronectin type 3 domain-containing protein
VDLALGTRLDATQTKKINTLSWEGNPENNTIDLESYRIYRKRANLPDNDFVHIASVLPNVFRYEDVNLPLAQKFTYGMTSMPKDPHGLESSGSEFVTEISVFAPLEAACRTVINSSLFRSEKINVISWKKNPLNEAITVLQYNIYRKKADQSDTQYRRISSVGGNIFEYQDRKLSFSDKFHYVITAVDTLGTESIASNSARETS